MTDEKFILKPKAPAERKLTVDDLIAEEIMVRALRRAQEPELSPLDAAKAKLNAATQGMDWQDLEGLTEPSDWSPDQDTSWGTGDE